MEIGIGMFGDLGYDAKTKTFQKPAERLKEIIAEVKLADEVGLDVFAMGEHHRPDYAVPAPEIMLSALATVTKNIKLASGVSVVSSADPVKLYQDFAMLDLISDQRAEIFAGRGSFIESFPLFGHDLKDYNELFEEKLELLNALNTQKSVTWEGEFRPPLKNQTVYPQPERELPIWIAVGGTPKSVQRAAYYGFPIIFAIIGGQLSQFIPLVNYYKEQYQRFGHDPKKMQIGIHSHTYVGDSEAAVTKDYFPLYKQQMDRIGRDRGWAPYTDLQFEGGMSEDGALFMGNPEAVAEKIIHAHELFGMTRFVAHVDVGAPDHQKMMKSIELFGKEVVPIVKKHLG